MGTLLDKANSILDEKNEKIIPENIRRGITVFDVEGDYAAEVSVEDVAKFTSVEDLNASIAEEGDYAIVLNRDISDYEDGVTKYKYWYFPETITLAGAVDVSISGEDLDFANIDWMEYGSLLISPSSMVFYSYRDTGDGTETLFDIRYTSQDGITYTRSTFTGDSNYIIGDYLYIANGTKFYISDSVRDDGEGGIIPMPAYMQEHNLVGLLQYMVNNFTGIYQYIDDVWRVDTTQFNTTNDDVYKTKTYFGANGSGTGTLGTQYINTSNKAIFKSLVTTYFSGEMYVTDNSTASSLFTSLTQAPYLPKLHITSNVTSLNNLYSNCISLKEINVSSWDVSNVTSMMYMIANCINLDDDTWNSILQICIDSAVSDKWIAGNLTYSVDSELEARIESLSNYQDFIDAGWSIYQPE